MFSLILAISLLQNRSNLNHRTSRGFISTLLQKTIYGLTDFVQKKSTVRPMRIDSKKKGESYYHISDYERKSLSLKCEKRSSYEMV